MQPMKCNTLLMTVFLISLAGCNAATDPLPARQHLGTDTRQETWNLPYARGKIVHTDRYRIYTTVLDDRTLRVFPGFMEAAYGNYLDLTGLPASDHDRSMVIYLMGSRDEWVQLTKHVIGREVPIQAGGFCYQRTCFFFDIGTRMTLSVAAHEGLHQFFRHRLKDPIPMWLEEGMCVQAEGFDLRSDSVAFDPNANTSRFNDLRSALTSGRFKPLRHLLDLHSMEVVSESKFPEEVVSYYGQLWGLVKFIRSRPEYNRGLQKLLADARAGRLHHALQMPRELFEKISRRPLEYNRTVSIPLFRHYIARDISAFHRRYRRYCEKETHVH